MLPYSDHIGASALEPVWTSAPRGETDGIVIGTHPAYQRIIANMPPAIVSGFTRQQLLWLSIASTPSPSPHIVQYRASLKILFKRYYLTVFFGEESRSTARLSAEGQLSLYRRIIAYYLMISALAATLMLGAVLVLYVVKSICGIDLTDGPSIFHDLIFR